MPESECVRSVWLWRERTHRYWKFLGDGHFLLLKIAFSRVVKQDGARDVAADRGAVSAELLTNDNKASWGKGRMEQIELCKWMAAEPSGQYAAGVGVC